MAEPVQFAVHGPIDRADLAGLCDRVCRFLAENPAVEILCDVRSVAPDAVTVDALARLQLAAQRTGRRVHLQNASAELLDLVEFMALENVLSTRAAGRRAERRLPCRGRT